MYLGRLLIGAAAALLLTNETVQKAAIKSAVRGWLTVQGSVEELKERFRDAAAESRAAQGQKEAPPSTHHSEAP